MKTKEELNVLKEEVEALNKKLAELTDEELEQINGGEEFRFDQWFYVPGPDYEAQDPTPYYPYNS